MKKSILGILPVAFAFAASGQSAANDVWPSKPVRIIASFTAGSTTDTSARILAEQLRKDLGATVIVENKPGAQGVIGTDFAAKAAPDGYTLVLSSSSLHSANPGLFKRMPYDPVKDFVHISRIATIPMMALVRTESEHKTLDQLVAKAKSGKLFYGYGSAGTQVAAATLNSLARVTAEGVAYKGVPGAMADMLGGQIDYVVADQSVSTALLRGGKLRALAISTDKRLPQWPNVPTFAESGYKEFDLVVWVGLAAPAGTPPDVVRRINSAVTAALSRPEVQEKYAALGMEVTPNSVEDQTAFVRSQLAVWTQRIKSADIQPE
jgi:tripartite-type tricarboxylate transporter receptor subunit TctC